MKRSLTTVLHFLESLLIVAVFFAIAPATHAAHVAHTKKAPSQPFPGIVEGTVVAISATSVTIEENTHSGTVTSSTEKTFLLMNNVRINADHQADGSHTIAAGSFVSLMLQHVGANAGKVMEIRVRGST